MNKYLNMLNGYGDRVARIALFDIFHRLENKQLKDEKGRPIDGFGIGLLGILFFFENMLLRNKNTGIKALADFLSEVLSEQIELTEEGYYELAKTLIQVYRPSNGKRNSRTFYNYETSQEEEVSYSILKAEHWDADSKTQYYTLDEQGLELVFATKEYFSEFQLSINQLMLRKQLEKGEFVDALRQIDEMRISVHTIKDKMIRVRRDIQKNIISDDTYSRYKGIIEDINRRLTQEQDEFKALSEFIKETKEHLNNQHHHMDKEMDALELIVRIDNELAHVHYLHSELLNDSIDLKTTAIEAAGESLYYAGVTSFNFEKEITSKLLNVPLPFETGEALVMPFLKQQKFETWSLLTVFAPQLMDRPKRHVYDSFLELEEDHQPSDNRVRQTVYRLLIETMMKIKGDGNELELKTLFDSDNSILFDTREFSDLMILMHHRSPIIVKEVLENEEHLLHMAVTQFMQEFDCIKVEEQEGHVNRDGNYELRSMKIMFEGGIDD